MKIFRQLRWKLTLSYTLVTVGALLVITLLLGGILLIRIFEAPGYQPPGYDPEGYIESFMDTDNETSSYLYYCQILSQTPQDPELVSRMLTKLKSVFAVYDLFQVGQVMIRASTIADLRAAAFKSDGTLLGVSPPNDPSFVDQVGKVFNAASVPGLEKPFKSALAGATAPNLLYTELQKDQRYVFVAPCLNRAGGNPNQVTGIIAIFIDAVPTEADIPAYTLNLALRGLVVFLLGMGIMGAIFGYYFARGLTARFNRLSSTTDLWSDGDFSRYIDDSVGDEISQLAQRLNNMAGQLQSLLRRRQDMAVSEERNRLARDLHDSAKQQALAASFELGTALTLYDGNPQEARKHLVEADTLVDSVRRELTNLVDDLRPQATDGEDFSELLQSYGTEWSHRSGIRLDVHVKGSDVDLQPVTREALLRIAQEALANVARHSTASQAEISIEYGKDFVAMFIKDDGRGFDTSAQHSGLGLRSMQERATSLGGSFSVASEPGRGTRIAATLPKSG